jgi:hypothetical protein
MKKRLILFVIGVSLLCLPTQLKAQEGFLEKLLQISSTPGTVIHDTVYIQVPCPQKPKPKGKVNQPPPIAEVCTQTTDSLVIDTAIQFTPHEVVNDAKSITINQTQINQYFPEYKSKDLIDFDYVRYADAYNKRISNGNAKIWTGLGLQLTGVGIGVYGACRDYNFNITTTGTMIQYKNHNKWIETSVNNIAAVIAEQERQKRAYLITGGSIFLIGTGLEVWGILQHNGNKVTVGPNGLTFKKDLKYDRRHRR